MATPVTVTVNPGGGADYTSLNAAMVDLGATYGSFVTSDVEVTIECSGSTADTTAVNLGGHGITTDATRFLRIKAAAGNEATAEGFKTDRYRLTVSNNNNYALQATGSCRNVYLERLQISHTITAGNSFRHVLVNSTSFASGAFTNISGCRLRFVATNIAEGSTDRCTVIRHTSADNIIRLYNTIVEATGTEAAHIRNMTYSSNVSFPIYNCTFYGGFASINSTGNDAIVKNTLFAGAGNDMASGVFDAASDYNASDRADTHVGSNSRDSQTFSFVDAANGDYSLTTSDAGARNFGTDLSADGVLAFSVDIEGTARPQDSVWDIGVFEVIASLIAVVVAPARTIRHR